MQTEHLISHLKAFKCHFLGVFPSEHVSWLLATMVTTFPHLQKIYTKSRCNAKHTLEVITFSVHKNVVDQNDTEDAGPEMDVTEHQHKAHVLGGGGETRSRGQRTKGTNNGAEVAAGRGEDLRRRS